MDTTVNAVWSSQMEPPKCACGELATCAFSYENHMSQYACRAHDPTLQPAWQHFQPPNFSYTTKILSTVTWAGGAASGGGFNPGGGVGTWTAVGGGGGGLGGQGGSSAFGPGGQGAGGAGFGG